MGELPSQTFVNSFIPFVLLTDVPGTVLGTDISANQRSPPSGTCIIPGEGDTHHTTNNT